MEKFSLEMLRLTSGEVLGRSQMKNINGGEGSFALACSHNTCGGRDMIRCCSPYDECSGATGQCRSRPIG